MAGGSSPPAAAPGDGVIVVATAPHRLMFATALARAGIDVAGERDADRLLREDATGLLSRILGKDGLDHRHFRSVIAGLIRHAAASGRRVRGYGEVVGLLWDVGRVTIAIELEARWNGLGALVPFSLLCSCPSHPVASGAAADAAREVYGLHSNVIATRSFPAELDSVRAARHVTSDLLDGEAVQRLAEDAAIVVTELASNAVLHARSGFTLTISRTATSVKIAVRDSQPVVSAGDATPFDIQAGHGLSVVGQLASAWDVERLPDGKVVWAELPAS